MFFNMPLTKSLLFETAREIKGFIDLFEEKRFLE